MEDFAIRFINYIIAKKYILEWKSFQVGMLVHRTNNEEERIAIGRNFAVADNNWNDKENKDYVEEYLYGRNLIVVERGGLADGSLVRLNENGKLLLKLGSIQAYDLHLQHEEEERNRKKILESKIMEATISNVETNRRLYYTTIVLGVSAGIAALYYLFEALRDIKKDHRVFYEKQLFPLVLTSLEAIPILILVILPLWEQIRKILKGKR